MDPLNFLDHVERWCPTYAREWVAAGLMMIVGGAFVYVDGTRRTRATVDDSS
jgi:hypothetical protein